MVFSAAALLASHGSFAASEGSAVTVTISAHDKGRRFDGIGAASGGGAVSRLLINYPDPQRSQILDYLFKPHYGASLQLLKVEIGGDGNSTEGSEPSHMHTEHDQNYDRGFESWVMREAKKRNPDIKLIGLAWDFPGWVKQANSQATADYLANWLEGEKRVQGLDIDYVGVWNETNMPYDFIKRLKKTLVDRHLNTQIIADDLVNTWSIADGLRKDTELNNDVDVVATHYPKFKSTESAKTIGKPIWSSEDGPWGDVWATAGEQSAPYAEVLNRNYVLGSMTSTMLWCLVSSYYDIIDIPNAGLMRADTPWSGHYEVTPPLWIVAHTTQFAEPGWQYADHASGILPEGGSFVTLRHLDDFSLIIETIAAAKPQQMNVTISKELPQGPLALWRTNKTNYFEELIPITPINGKFLLTLEPSSVYSITTTHTQHKGDAKPLSPKPFAVPYQDDFEDYALGSTTPRYFIEQNGSYEIALCDGGHRGKCLRQVVNEHPIVWTYATTTDLLGTASIIGDKRWSNYTVSADIYLEEPGYGRIMGRVPRVTLDGQIKGYELFLYSDGHWELRTATDGGKLASGLFSAPLKTWHHVALTFNGQQISVEIDRKLTASVLDAHYSKGMAGLGNAWNQGEYANFAIVNLKNVNLFETEHESAATKVPDAPTLFVPGALSEAVRLTWSSTEGASGYRINYGIEKEKYTSVLDAGSLNSLTVRTLTNGQKYYFQIVAYNDRGSSAPSGVMEATPEGGK